MGVVQKIASKVKAAAAKQPQGALLNRMAGKKVYLAGKFAYGVKDWLSELTEAQQGKIKDQLDASIDYLVLEDLSTGKTVQKQVTALNAKGATIQVVDVDAFKQIVTPTTEEVLALIRAGKPNAGLLRTITSIRHAYYQATIQAPLYTFAGENFDAVDLLGFVFHQIAFEQCSFVGAKLVRTDFFTARNCDFSHAQGNQVSFNDVDGSRFCHAKLKNSSFNGSFERADFTGAELEAAVFASYGRARGASTLAGAVFSRSSLPKARFNNISLKAPDFEAANLSGCVIDSCALPDANFANAALESASMVDCALSRADFSRANCRLANLAGADLTGARFDGTDLDKCNLRGAKVGGADFATARNYDPGALAGGTVGPALNELDSLSHQARRIQLRFRISQQSGDEGEEVGIDTAGLQWGWGVRLPHTLPGAGYQKQTKGTLSDAMLFLANMLVNHKVRYETVEVQSTKSPKGGKELRDLVITGISEAFAQPVPLAEELAAATKAWRDKDREKNAAARKQREEQKQKAEAAQKREVAKIEKKIEKAVGKVTDIATFLKALELRADPAKIKKATSMLKAEKFQLFKDIGESHLYGVVKSQTDADLVYACRIDSAGQYACCTQNLNICGGLRGSICKHLLVLIIGLVKAGELDPADIDTWVSKTHNIKPELNKETMGEIFIRYKGAEAGEVDWRPTETMPEDYYAL